MHVEPQVAAFDPAQGAHRLHKGRHAGLNFRIVIRVACNENAHAPQMLGLLCLDRRRPENRRTAE
jgi:hypothetical protein